MNKIYKFFNLFVPPDKWKLPVIIVLGIFCGLFVFVFYISNAPSYLSNDSETCINCHVMFPEYASFKHSSHARLATCNDCHVPHENVFRKYYFKATDGLRHSTIFTMRWEPQVIQIKDAGINVVQQNCKRCHQDMVEMIAAIEVTGDNYKQGKGKRCWDCHREVPHGMVNSLASEPFALVPLLPKPYPNWLKNYIKSENIK